MAHHLTEIHQRTIGIERNCFYSTGDCRNSQPEIDNLPTDRLFTGQRYDDTGLYYYGARYYDPTIGRFISADTIVPDPMNPQAWNRYTYCLNNPLKYNDPSGNIVKIGNSVSYSYSDGERALTYHSASYSKNDETLINGWNLFRGACPDIADAMEKSNKEYSIGWSKGPIDAITLGDKGDQTIWIQSSLKEIFSGDELTGYVTAQIGHESYHAQQGYQSNSVYEEVGAYQRGYDTKTAINTMNLGYTLNYRYIESQCKTVDLSITNPDRDTQLLSIQSYWYNNRTDSAQYNMYSNLPIYAVSGSWNDFTNVVEMMINLAYFYMPWFN